MKRKKYWLISKQLMRFTIYHLSLNTYLLLLILLLITYHLPFITYAGIGISFGPGEITFGNLEIGQTYDFGKISAQQFEVVNKSDNPVDVKIFKFKPTSTKAGFEPIPDTEWVKVYPEELQSLEPGKKYNVSVKISVPNDKKYLGKNYEIFLQARVVSKAFMGVAADSRVLIKISDTVTGKRTEFKEEPQNLKLLH